MQNEVLIYLKPQGLLVPEPALELQKSEGVGEEHLVVRWRCS